MFTGVAVSLLLPPLFMLVLAGLYTLRIIAGGDCAVIKDVVSGLVALVILVLAR